MILCAWVQDLHTHVRCAKGFIQDFCLGGGSIGVGSGGGGGGGGKGGNSPLPNFTHCLHNELHCSIVDGIACRHCSSRKSHFCCLKKCRPPPPPPSQNIFLRLWEAEEGGGGGVAGLLIKAMDFS